MADARGPVSTSPLRVLVHRNFWPYFVGNLLSNCGSWFQNLAQAVFVYRLTGSAFLVGLVNFAQFIGVFVLAPWAGSAADRFDRRRLLMVTQVGAVLVTGSLALLANAGLASAQVVILMALVLGLSLRAGSQPAVGLRRAGAGGRWLLDDQHHRHRRGAARSRGRPARPADGVVERLFSRHPGLRQPGGWWRGRGGRTARSRKGDVGPGAGGWCGPGVVQ
jgi:hypothetical protein